MMNRERDEHPDLDTLAAHAAGELGGDEAAALAEHVAGCRHCRLEARQLARFATIEQDSELKEEADWAGHEPALQRTSAKRDHAPVPESPGRRPLRPLAWLLPVAAAAILLFVLWPDRDPAPPVDQGVFRGDDATVPLVLIEPAGELAVAPTEFAWRTDAVFDTYRLKVFLPSLDIVHRRDDLAGPPYIMPDSVRTRLEPGQTYLWQVTGLTGIEAVAVSDNAWFVITPAD